MNKYIEIGSFIKRGMMESEEKEFSLDKAVKSTS